MQTSEMREESLNGLPRVIPKTKYGLILNQRLREARNNKKMSSAAVCIELTKRGFKICHSSLRGYEATEQSMVHRYPSIPVTLALADFYDVSLDYLFGRNDKPKLIKNHVPKIPEESRDLKVFFESEKPVSFAGKKITPKQKELIQSYIGFALNRF